MGAPRCLVIDQTFERMFTRRFAEASEGQAAVS